MPSKYQPHKSQDNCKIKSTTNPSDDINDYDDLAGCNRFGNLTATVSWGVMGEDWKLHSSWKYGPGEYLLWVLAYTGTPP